MAMNHREVDRVVRELREYIALVEEAQEKSSGWYINIRSQELAVLLSVPMLDRLDIEFLSKVAGRWSWTIRPDPKRDELLFIIW